MRKTFLILFLIFTACSNNKKEANYYFIKGLNEYQKNEKVKALENYKKAHKLDENNLEINRELAFLYADLGDIEKSKEYYLKVLEINPHDENALENLLTIFYSEGDIEGITRYSEQILDKNSLLYKHSQEKLKNLKNNK